MHDLHFAGVVAKISGTRSNQGDTLKLRGRAHREFEKADASA